MTKTDHKQEAIESQMLQLKVTLPAKIITKEKLHQVDNESQHISLQFQADNLLIIHAKNNIWRYFSPLNYSTVLQKNNQSYSENNITGTKILLAILFVIKIFHICCKCSELPYLVNLHIVSALNFHASARTINSVGSTSKSRQNRSTPSAKTTSAVESR